MKDVAGKKKVNEVRPETEGLHITDRVDNLKEPWRMKKSGLRNMQEGKAWPSYLKNVYHYPESHSTPKTTAIAMIHKDFSRLWYSVEGATFQQSSEETLL